LTRKSPIQVWCECAIGAGAPRNRLRSNSMSIWLVSKRKLAISARRRRSWSRPQAPTPLMRLRFGSPIGDGRPVGRPPDTCEEGRFGNILTGCHQASIAVAVRLSTTFDGTLGAHLLHKSDQGRKQVRGPRTNPPKINGLIADYPCHRIDGVGNHPAYDFGRCISRPFEPGMFAAWPRGRLDERPGRHTGRLGDRVRR
jgi:hypothetical protein